MFQGFNGGSRMLGIILWNCFLMSSRNGGDRCYLIIFPSVS